MRLCLLLAFLSADALAVVPLTVSLQGQLTTSAGQPAPDGDYVAVVTLWEAEVEGVELWKETQGLQVSGGVFSAVLGLDQALTQALFESGKPAWVQVQVNSEPPFARRALHSVPYALVSGGLSCSACVTAGHLDAASVDGLLGVLGYVKLDALAAVATSGLYTDLDGTPALAPVAISGKYTDLDGTPALAPVAISGNYADLDDAPALAPVATGGQFGDLGGIPPGLEDGDNDTTYTGEDFALSNKGCSAGAYVTGVDADGSPICTSGMSSADLALSWMSIHAAAAAACRGSTASGGSGCCGNSVRVRNTASDQTCATICADSGEACDAEVSVWGRSGKATANGELVGSFYNYGCSGQKNGGSEAGASSDAALNNGYWSYCCCRK